MANYNIDIAVALKGAERLKAFNKKIKETEEISKVVAINMKLLGKNNDLVVRSFNSLSKAVSEAKKNFNEAAIGTSNQKKAAKELVAAQKELNKELEKGNQLLKIGTKMSPTEKSIRRNQQLRQRRPVQPLNPADGNSFAAFSRSIRGATAYSGPIGPG